MRRSSPRPLHRSALLLSTLLLVRSGCGTLSAVPHPGRHGGKVRVVATTPILADLTRQVAGDRAEVTSLVPEGADPHSYAPGLRTLRDVSYADLAVTNGMLLEPQKLVRTVDSTLPDGARKVAVAEQIEAQGGQLRPLTEDLSLDTVWLGLRAEGGPDRSRTAPGPTQQAGGARKGSDDAVVLESAGVSGPGHAAAFITGTFGTVQKVVDSDGDAEPLELPDDAHTHLSWAFTRPGEYDVRLRATRKGQDGEHRLGEETVHFVVGQDPAQAVKERGKDAVVLDSGHVDVTARTDAGRIVLRRDTEHGPQEVDPDRAVVVVPPKALQELPAGHEYRFLGHPGDQVYLLAQAVLGEHVHGDIDPHFWHSVPNAEAAVKVIRDALAAQDPDGAAAYRARAQDYLQQLDGLQKDLQAEYSTIPRGHRNLVTTHDGYGYLAQAYGLNVAGFVTPVPGTEPSIQQRRRLTRALEDLRIPAVFTDHGVLTRTNVLQQTADEAGVQVCDLYADTLDDEVPHYTDMMRRNADEIRRCLG